MTLLLGAEHESLQQVIRRLMVEHSPRERINDLLQRGQRDEPLWERLTQQLNLTAMMIPRRYGGDGYSLLEVSIAQEQVGYALAQVPLLATTTATAALLLADSEEAREQHLPKLATGELIGSLAVAEDAGWRLETMRTTAKRTGSRWSLDGVKNAVLDGDIADLLVVAAAKPDGSAGLFLLSTTAEGVFAERQASVDPTQHFARVELRDAPAVDIGGQDVGRAFDAITDFARVALAADQVGGLRACVDSAVAYAIERVQFGRQIGSFQAVKHRCADMYLDWEQGYAALRHATSIAPNERQEFGLAVSVLREFIGARYVRAATDNIQLHGGMGYAWECDAHLHYKRAMASQSLFGERHRSRAALAARLARLQPTNQ